MKILYYFKEKNTLMDKWQRFHIFDELQRHNCEIEVFNPLKFNSIEEANENLIKYIKNEKFDLFMTPHNHEELYIESIKKIKKIGIPTLLICFDSLMTYYKHEKVVKYFDLVMLSQVDQNGFFEKIGCKYIVSHYAANPYVFKAKANNEIDKINFCGTPYGSRINKINILLKNSIEIDLYANIKSEKSEKSEKNILENIKTTINLSKYDVGRKILLGAIKQKIKNENNLIENDNLNIFNSVSLKDANSIFNKYALSLSISEARNTGVLKKPINIVHLRNFEIPMSGGLQICSYFDELSECFKEDKEIIFYRNNDEFVEKCKFYLKEENYELRKKIKIAARIRAEQEHTWFKRFKKAFDILGLSNKYIENPKVSILN